MYRACALLTIVVLLFAGAKAKGDTPATTVVYNGECTTSADVDALPVGHWCRVPGSNLDAHKPTPQPSGDFDDIMIAWNGGAFDSIRNNLIIWGGGHGDYAGNEIYTFNMDSLTWNRASEPSPKPYGNTGETYPDGQPRSRHTYDHIQFLPNVDLFFAPSSCCKWPGNVGDTLQVSTYDFKQSGPGAWQVGVRQDRPAKSGNITGISSAYDPVTGYFWMNTWSGGASLLSYDPVKDQWKRYSKGKDIAIYQTADVDSKRHLYVQTGADGKTWYYKLNSSNPKKIKAPTSGDQTLEKAKAPGFVYDAVSDRMVGWDGGANVYTLDTANWSWVKVEPAAGNLTIPTPAQSRGTYGRFRYVPGKNVFVVVNATDEDVYIYRLQTGTGTITPKPGPRPDVRSNKAVSIPDPPTPSPAQAARPKSLSSGQSASRASAVRTQTATKRSTPVAPGADAESDWVRRSSAPGVLQAINFNSEREVLDWVHDYENRYGVSWDTQNKTSGQGSLRLNIKNTNGANSGAWRIWLSADQREFKPGDVFYVSYRGYYTKTMATYEFQAKNGGWKDVIISRHTKWMNGIQGKRSDCSNGCDSNQLNEIVSNNAYYRGFPHAYHRDRRGSYKGMKVRAATACSNTDYRLQNAVDHGPQNVASRKDCPADATGKTCARFVACMNDRARYGGLYSYGHHKGGIDPHTGAVPYPHDGWMTTTMRVAIGDQPDNSSFTMWLAHDGDDYTKVIERNDLDLTAPKAPFHDTVWLTRYDTGRKPDANRPSTYALYDELIISTEMIPAPGFSAPGNF